MASKRPLPWAGQTDPFADGMKRYTMDQTNGGPPSNSSPFGPLPSQRGQTGPAARPAFADLQQTTRENSQLDTKYKAMSSDPNLTDKIKQGLGQAWEGTKKAGQWTLDTPVAKGIMWGMEQVNRPWNALKGGLRETQNYNDQTFNQGKHKMFDMGEVKAAGKGIAAGFKNEQQYDLGTYLSKFAKGNLGDGAANALDFSPGRFAEGIGLTTGKYLAGGLIPALVSSAKKGFKTDAGENIFAHGVGKSGPQTDPNFKGIKNATIADTLGFAADAKAMDRLVPVRAGKTIMPGATRNVVDDLATTAARTAREAEVAGVKKGLLRSTQSDASMRTALEALGIGTKEEIKGLTRKELQAFMGDARGATSRTSRGAAKAEPIIAKPAPTPVPTAGSMPSDENLRPFIQQFVDGDVSTLTSQQLRQEWSDLPAMMKQDYKGPMPATASIPAAATTATAAKTASVTRETLGKAGSANADIVAKALGLDTSTAVPDIMKAIQGDPEVFRVLKANLLGHEVVPFKGAQVAANKAITGAAKGALSHVPAAESFMSLFSNGVESSRTAGRIDMNKITRESKQGAKSIGGNLQERLSQQLTKVGGITKDEGTALYYAVNMGKSLDDPEFVQQLMTHKGISLGNDPATLKKLESLRQWWKPEQEALAKAGEAAGHFKAVDSEYLPIFRTKPAGEAARSQAGQLGQEFGGLRSIQKNREVDVSKLLEQSGNLAGDNFVEAIGRYGDIFGNLEGRRHILDQLVEKGIGSWKPEQGMVNIADVLKHADAAVEGKPFYLKESLKDPFAEQLFGFGGLKAQSGLPGLFKKMGKITEPWKATVTTMNPNHFIRNNIDDVVTNSLYDSGLPNAKKVGLGVTRETPINANVRDWVKNSSGQWDYQPGARNAMQLSPADAKTLADKMGVTMTQNEALAQFSNDSAPKRMMNKLRNIVEKPNESQRSANFTKNLQEFGDNKLAGAATGQSLVDYGGLTPFQRDVVKPVMPFSTFAMKNPAVALDKMVQNPENLGKLAMAQQRLDPNNEVQLQERYQGKPVLAWNDKQTNQSSILDLGLSQTDLGWLGNPGKIPDIARRQFGPLGQVALGEMTGRDSFGREIDKGMRVAGPIEKALGLATQGQDGKMYVDGHTKFLLDSILSGVNNNLAATGKMTDGDFSTFSPLKTVDTDVAARSVLLQKMAAKNDALDKLRQMGFNIPLMKDLTGIKNDPFARAVR